MATDGDKENIADGLVISMSPSKFSAPKQLKKARSLSMGPGALSEPLKEDAGNRRKSAIISSVKTIIASQGEDAAKRRAARRKSLANRRVSFAPEATQYTWDVVEYLKDATTSSSASESTRRASSITQDTEPDSQTPDDDGEPPSTPPEQVEDSAPDPSSQRDVHQAKNRRRSSGIPPMNFNNPEDVYSSSPLSHVDSSPASADSIVLDGSDDEDTAMSLVTVEDMTERSVASNSSNESTSASDRLDNALRQATIQSRNQMLMQDENGEMTMDMAGDEITSAFQPFMQQKPRAPMPARQLSAMQDQENINPFLPNFQVTRDATTELQQDDDHTQDMSMDMTRAMGGIIQKVEAAEGDSLMSQPTAKRRRLSTNSSNQGSPAQRPASRRASIRRRRSSAAESVVEEQTMEFTRAVGGIKQHTDDQRETEDASLDSDTMDFTMVQGGILGTGPSVGDVNLPADEDLSMELTMTLDKTIKVPDVLIPVTPSPARPVMATPKRSPRKSPRRSIVPQPSPRMIETDSPRLELVSPKVTVMPNVDDIQVVATPPERTVSLEAPVRFSPLKETAAKAHSLADSIRMLSTPRKQSAVSPLKRAALTPKKNASPAKQTSPRKAITPKRMTPRKRVRVEVVQPEVTTVTADEHEQESEKIQLQDFLKITNIRFMDLTTTKRRHTGYPGTDRNVAHDLDESEEQSPGLEESVAAAVGTLPVLSMYQHMCHEMKNYISGGRDDLRTLEAEVYENQPPLFKEYMSAPLDERSIMDNQFKNMKTNARLQSKAGWHAWRAQLLNELKKGLVQSVSDFDWDAKILEADEQMLSAMLPSLDSRYDDLSVVAERLQQRADEMASHDHGELEAARENLVTTENELEKKLELLAQLQAELTGFEGRIEDVRERKTECQAEIEEAERVREEFRGWSAAEVAEVKFKVDTIERETGWRIVSATSEPHTLTLGYLSDFELFIHPDSFYTQADGQPNSPISLAYVGDQVKRANSKSRPLTTTKRFFLQLLRAHLLALPQNQTPISTVLRTISSVWKTAMSVTEAVRILNLTCITDEVILNDEHMALDVTMLLASLQTKIRVRFEIGATASLISTSEDITTSVKADVKVVYGEKYDQPKMGEFLSTWTGGKVGTFEDVAKWAAGVEDLRVRLIKRGKKGERV